jgi:hypothetical protein
LGNASSSLAPAAPGNPGNSADPTSEASAPATITQTNGRQRGDRGRPSGNSTGSNSSIMMAGTQAQLLTQPIHSSPGTAPG